MHTTYRVHRRPNQYDPRHFYVKSRTYEFSTKYTLDSENELQTPVPDTENHSDGDCGFHSNLYRPTTSNEETLPKVLSTTPSHLSETVPINEQPPVILCTQTEPQLQQSHRSENHLQDEISKKTPFDIPGKKQKRGNPINHLYQTYNNS